MKNIENAEFEIVKDEIVPEEVSNIEVVESEMMESDETEETSDSLAEDIAEFNETSDSYRKTEIKDEQMFLNPETGMMVKRIDLPPFEQIKVTAKATGHLINEPKKNCKHCHGRGYTGFKLDKSPVPCDCIFKEYYASNKDAKKNSENSVYMNRKYQRAYAKHKQAQGVKFFQELMKQAEIMGKSKKNLRKTTGGVKIEQTEEEHIETAEGTI